MRKQNQHEAAGLMLKIFHCLQSFSRVLGSTMTGQAIKKVLLMEAVYTKAASMLTSALLAEPSEDQANARHLEIIFHGKFINASKTSI